MITTAVHFRQNLYYRQACSPLMCLKSHVQEYIFLSITSKEERNPQKLAFLLKNLNDLMILSRKKLWCRQCTRPFLLSPSEREGKGCLHSTKSYANGSQIQFYQTIEQGRQL